MATMTYVRLAEYYNIDAGIDVQKDARVEDVFSSPEEDDDDQ
jgi:hypothetical protein